MPVLKKLPGLIDEAKERFSLLLILRQMASSDDAENEYLRFLYGCLTVAVDNKDSPLTFCQSILLETLCGVTTEGLRGEPQQVRFQLYGSSTEDLHVGVSPDFDFMIFPTADESMIDDELIEYFPSNPLYVRIRGTGHPVLQSCLAENTEYVATSASKNFHPAIFGPMRSSISTAEVLPVFGQKLLPLFSASVKNRMTSPAVKWTLDFSKLLNELKLVLPEHTKWGEESSISTFLSSEDETEFFGLKCFESFFREPKVFVDNIPSFRCLTWPMVAQEWRKRQRKWPSPDVVDQVIREGFHLVVKAPKNGGNPECDFRISFSHAEYLLSQQINEIQRECYRCLKAYHREYLSTEPKAVVSFHLKNIFLRTIEETGGEMWIESRRAECMWKLFANLLKALRERHLPHYFVRSCNLFGIDYIEDPAILESLTRRVEQIMENPVKFAEELILVTQGKRSSPVQEQEQMNSPSNQLRSELKLLSSLEKSGTERALIKKVCLGTIKDLIEAVNNGDWNVNDINVRHHVLTFVKQVAEFYKYTRPLSEAGFEEKGFEDMFCYLLNPVPENPFVWYLFHMYLPGLWLEEDKKEIILTLAKHFEEALLGYANSNGDDIPLD